MPTSSIYALLLCSALTVHGHVNIVVRGSRQLLRHAPITATDSWSDSEDGSYGGGGRSGGYSGGYSSGRYSDEPRERRAARYGGGGTYGGYNNGKYDGGRPEDGGGDGYRDGGVGRGRYGGGRYGGGRYGSYGGSDGGGYGGGYGEGYGDGYGRGGGRGRGGAYGGGYGGGRSGGRGGAGSRERRDTWRREQGANKKPGDWTCPSCGANVFASKSRCYICQTPNPDPVARANAADRSRGGRGTPPWHPDARRGGVGAWQGLDGGEDFEESLA
jgi:hypothetical protein